MPPKKPAPKRAAPKAKGAMRASPKAKAAAHKSLKKPAKLTPKAKDDIKLMKSYMQTVKMELPEDWPEGAIPNARAFAPLPEGWHHAKKATNASSKGVGGNLHPCFVGPQGKLFWHKKDLYKYLGIPMEKEDLSEVRRPMNPLVQKEFPPDAVLRRTEVRTDCEYIDKRCNGLAGLTVGEALQGYKFDKNGTTTNYRLSDLRYDIEGGRIVVEAVGQQPAKRAAAAVNIKAEAEAKPEEKRAKARAPETAKKPAPAKPKRRAPTTARRSMPAAKGARKAGRGAPAVLPIAGVQVGGSSGSRDPYVPRRGPALAALPAPALPAPSKAAPGTEEAKHALQHMQARLLAPLMKQRACGTEGELAICTLVGVGQMYGIDDCVLKVLPDVLRKEPSERSAFGQAALEQFQAELDKHA